MSLHIFLSSEYPGFVLDGIIVEYIFLLEKLQIIESWQKINQFKNTAKIEQKDIIFSFSFCPLSVMIYANDTTAALMTDQGGRHEENTAEQELGVC